MLNDEKVAELFRLHGGNPFVNELRVYDFARAVESAVREECAKVCDRTGPDDTTGENCAERIRAGRSK